MFAKESVSRRFSVMLVIVLVLAVTPLQVAHAAGMRYAKPAASGTGDCLSWINACTLQTALTGAASGDEIWVAAGTYKPTAGTDRTVTFQLKNGVALYGGFAGTETARTQRNPAVNVTILSGDIDNNDSQTPIITDLTTVTGNTTNSWHVVTGATGATLDGFTITAGNNSAATTPNNRGGGMYNNSSSPTLTNVTFSGNWAGYGGGMANHGGSSPTLTNVTFSGNSAAYGGGMFNWNSSPTLTNITFSGNNASGTLAYGGGMYNDSSSPVLTNVTFSGNTATTYGGGMYNYDGNPALTNVTFSGNSATWGGGMYNDYVSSLDIRDTILWGNTATTAGAQIWDSGSTPSVSDSVVQGDYVGGTNIITTTPLLGTLGNYGGSTQTIPLLAGSSAIDTGNDSTCATTDQRGVARPQGAHCDIGAYEVDTTAPIVTSITRLNPSPTNLASVDFTVTFSETVTGVDVIDFGLTTTGVSGATVSGVSGAGSVYTVAATTGNGSGTVRLDVVDNDSIVDLALNPLGGAGPGNGSYTSGETYDVRLYRTYLPLVVKY